MSSLRFFYEKYPALHVVAAGSLLEFTIAEISSFGVGRVRSLFMYPVSFDEFLVAAGETKLVEAKLQASPEKPLTEPVHQKLLLYFKRFLLLGGMPEVLVTYIEHNDLVKCGLIQDDLVTSLQSDFAKYRMRVPFMRIAEVFDSVIRQAGGKFMYSKAALESTNRQIKEAIELLTMAGLIIPVTHTAANGIPLGAEVNEKNRKMVLLDTGLFQRLLQLNMGQLLLADDFDSINKGAIAEQYTGLEILKAAPCYGQASLFYWHREARSSNAEVDYVVQKGEEIIPLEVKSGKKGAMNSLHLFLAEKKSPYGVRFSLENYAVYDKIKVYPLYAVADFIKDSLPT